MSGAENVEELRYYTLEELQKRLGLCRTMLYNFISSGDLIVTKFGRATRVSAADLQKFIDTRPRGRAAA